jgi:hypothetical protein
MAKPKLVIFGVIWNILGDYGQNLGWSRALLGFLPKPKKPPQVSLNCHANEVD